MIKRGKTVVVDGPFPSASWDGEPGQSWHVYIADERGRVLSRVWSDSLRHRAIENAEAVAKKLGLEVDNRAGW